VEFYITKKVFERALAEVVPFMDIKNTISRLSMARLELSQDGLTISGTDMEMGFSNRYEARCILPGVLLLGGRQLLEIIKALPNKEVHVRELDNWWIEIVCGKSYFKLAGLDSTGYPESPKLAGEDVTLLSIGASRLADMIDDTIVSVATDDSRYGLNGAFLESGNDDDKHFVRMVSTDGHRLTLYHSAMDAPTGEWLLPRVGLKLLQNWLRGVSADVELCLDSRTLSIRHGDVCVWMRLLEGDFPDYRQVIPQRFTRTAEVSRSDLLSCMKRVALLSSEKTHSVKIELGDEGIIVSTSNPDLGECRESVDATVSKPDGGFSIGVNARYMVDRLAKSTAVQVTLRLQDSLNPITIVDGSDTIAVIMPMRLD